MDPRIRPFRPISSPAVTTKQSCALSGPHLQNVEIGIDVSYDSPPLLKKKKSFFMFKNICFKIMQYLLFKFKHFSTLLLNYCFLKL